MSRLSSAKSRISFNTAVRQTASFFCEKRHKVREKQQPFNNAEKKHSQKR
jgi:hypothetical protein